MKAKRYFESCGRADRAKDNPPRLRPSQGKLPLWAYVNYEFGYIYQQRHPSKKRRTLKATLSLED